MPIKIKYLLPCPCGQRLAIEPRQAGEIISCACGQSLEAPTLLRLKKLEALIETEVSPPSVWDLGHGLMFFGIVILICCGGLAFGLLFLIGPPPSPLRGSPEDIYAMVENMPPREVWRTWIVFRKMGLNPRKQWAELHYYEKAAVYQVHWAFLGVIFFLATAFFAAGAVIVRRRNKRPTPRGRAPP
jgi:hypothetical protein